MGKRLNSLADDFAGISSSADNKVLELLSESKQQTETQAEKKRTTVEKTEKTNEQSQSKEAQLDKPKRPKVPRIESWGKPVVHFNTRIPDRMSELLDDLIYKLRKRGAPKTKQELALEAIHDLLRKHSM